MHNTFGVSSEHIELILSSPNNILGIEYCKALLRLNSHILPHALLRKGSGYHDTDFSLLSNEEFPSASGIRSLMKKSEGTVQSADLSRVIPSASLPGFLDSLKKGAWLSDSVLDLPLHYKLLLESEETLKMYPELSDALIRRILKSRNQYEGFSQFADLLKTRDITRSAICRSLVRIFLDQKNKSTRTHSLCPGTWLSKKQRSASQPDPEKLLDPADHQSRRCICDPR